MKNPEEYLDEVHFHKAIRNTLSQILSPDGIDDNMYERLLKAFNLIQKESYNQAVEDAADSADADYTQIDDSNFSIGHRIEVYVIKDSILKLKIK
jgi:hypothetical protein